VLRSIALFNRYGIPNVAVDRIASDLKISPGNLTYHFKRKRDLIRATLETVKQSLRLALERPVSVESARQGAEYLIRLFRTFWEQRFFFNSLAYLLTDDPRLMSEYTVFSRWVIDTIESDLMYLAQRGYFRQPVEPNNFRLLAENIWSQLLQWLRMQQIESPSATTPSDEAVYSAALHLWSLCHLWMDRAFADELLKHFRRLLISRKRTQR